VNEVKEYFSFGEWMRSSSRAKPTISASMSRSRLNDPTDRDRPPQPVSAAGTPHSSAKAGARA